MTPFDIRKRVEAMRSRLCQRLENAQDERRHAEIAFIESQHLGESHDRGERQTFNRVRNVFIQADVAFRQARSALADFETLNPRRDAQTVQAAYEAMTARGQTHIFRAGTQVCTIEEWREFALARQAELEAK
jgi:hypothetical protein